EALRAAVAKMPPQEQAQYADAWSIVENTIAKERTMLNNPLLSSLVSLIKQATFAQSFLRFAAEIAKPDSLRADGYHERELNDLKFTLLSPAPVYPDLEEAMLAGLLKAAVEEVGSTHPVVSAILCGRSPEVAARDIISNSKLHDLEYRTKLFEGRDKAVNEAPDSVFAMMRRVMPALRAMNAEFAQEVSAPRAEALRKIAQARFAVYGKSQYPDATFTLRLSYGTVKGYAMNGTIAPWKTTLYGLFDRAASFDNKGEFMLPKRFWERKDKLNMATPVNYVTTCDIIGGNSGSPVVNTNGELVGLIFDGNIESLPNRFVYNDDAARSVVVHPAFMMETLRKVYDAEKLVKELEGKPAK
ncbi:MAG: S46 family peptidase, partial [Bacteroidota bacterium]|nr:S46 family peptidase [Candidatus Kapabacteria bacterium]MDW8221118.1 S46 family peptidase [Bacteroidota bacterium]